jgi:hypothetical protein
VKVQFKPEERVGLVLDERITKSTTSPSFVPSLLEDRFSIAEPQTMRLTADSLRGDPETAPFLQTEQSAAFHLIYLSCTFHPSGREPFEQAWIAIRLSEPGRGTTSAVAWSMKPLHDSDLIERSGTIKLGAGLKMLNSVEPSGDVEIGEKTQKQQGFITAFGLQEAQPYWHFHKTAQRNLEGSYRLAIIIKRNNETVVRGAISAKATVRRTAALICTYSVSTKERFTFPFKLE